MEVDFDLTDPEILKHVKELDRLGLIRWPRNKSHDDGPCVYVIGPKDGQKPSKIGVTNCVRKRLARLSTGSSRKLAIHHVEKCDDAAAARRLEKAVHAQFFRVRLNGEWFNLSAKACVDGIGTVSLMLATPEPQEPTDEEWRAMCDDLRDNEGVTLDDGTKDSSHER